MPTNESAEPAAQAAEEAERRAERAKASLLSRVETLKHKFSDARDKVDLPAHIAKHPLPAVGIAFALGVAAALRHGGSASPGASGGAVRGAVWSALVAVGLRAMREIALGQLGSVAKQWWNEHGGASWVEASARRPSIDPTVER